MKLKKTMPAKQEHGIKGTVFMKRNPKIFCRQVNTEKNYKRDEALCNPAGVSTKDVIEILSEPWKW